MVQIGQAAVTKAEASPAWLANCDPLCHKATMTIRLPVLATALFAAPLAASAQPAVCPQFFPGGQRPDLLDPRLAQRTTLLCNDAYAALASGVTRGPLWSAEHLTAASVAAARETPRQGEFHPDDRLPPEDRAEIKDFRGSGYDRGHLSPSGDAGNIQAQQQSFSLANMVPQAPELNRGPWERIESATRRLAARRGELYVVTGPAFQGRQVRSIGAGVLVPSSIWKALYDPRAGRAGAYLCSNTAAPRCEVMSVAALACLVGIDPFPAATARAKVAAMPLPIPRDRAPEHNRQQRRSPRD